MLAINQLLQNRYRIIRRLGHGGMGAVYEAVDERFGTPIALKEIFTDAVSESQRNLVLKAFEREAQSLAKIRHEAVPFVRDYFSESDCQFLVMELVEGDDLAQRLAERQTPFPIEEGLEWLDQLLDTLDYLHSLSPPIIHRDIKPQNLKVTARGKIKLLDFGIVKNTDAASTRSHQTFMGATLDYSPIEQILRVIEPTYREFILLKYRAEAEAILAQNTDGRSDIYSSGATFYHLLTGQEPVDAPKRALELWSGNGDPLVDPSVINPSIPAGISAWLLKAMAVDRKDRFSTAAETRAALKKARTGNPSLTAVKDAQTEVITAEPMVPPTYKNSSRQTTIAFGTNNQTARRPNQKISSANRARRALPAFLIIALTTAAVAAWISVNPKKPAESSDKSAADDAVPTVSTTVIQTNESNPLPNVAPSPLPDAAPSASTTSGSVNRRVEKITKNSKPPPDAPKIYETGKPTPPKKSVRAAPKPKPPQDPNCVFTNSCRD